MPQTPNNTYYSPSNASISQSYDVEFDDALIDTRFWKARSEGTQLTGNKINVYTTGDITYGKNPIVENKIAALYLGNTIIGGDDEDPSRTSILGHSYISIDRILLIDIETDEVTIVERQSLVDITTGTVGGEKAFKRYITRDFFEGSEVNIRLVDKTVQNSLKPSHFVKFNRGSFMKLYEYTANDDGYEDGVFGGYGVRNNHGGIHTGSIEGPGLFGYGMTAAVSRSLFSTDSIQFVGSLPSELNDYTGDVTLSTLGTELAPITASAGSTLQQQAYQSKSI
jgi:hypothetical protein